MRIPLVLLRLRSVLFSIRSVFQGTSVHGTISVFGPTEFRSRMMAALSLLQQRAPDAYALLSKFVYSVTLSTYSGVHVTSKPAWITKGKNSVDNPIEILAAGLAHEAYHCKLYWEYRDAHPREPVPNEVFSGRDAELKCIAYQLEVLRRLGASEEIMRNAIRSYQEAVRQEFWKTPWEHRTW